MLRYRGVLVCVGVVLLACGGDAGNTGPDSSAGDADVPSCTPSGSVQKLVAVSSVDDLAVGGDRVYWAEKDVLKAAPITGGAPMTLASNLGEAGVVDWVSIAADADSAYVAVHRHKTGETVHRGFVKKVNRDGGSVTTLVDGNDPASSPLNIAIDATNVYFVDAVDKNVNTVPKAGGAAAVVINVGDCMPGSLAVDGASLFWNCRGDQGSATLNGGSVMRADKSLRFAKPSAASTLAQTPYDPVTLAVDDRDVWWLGAVSLGSADGALWRVAKGGGAPAQVADKLATWKPALADYRRLAAGAGGAYVSAPTVHLFVSGLLEKFTPGGPTTVIACDARRVAVDATHVYWEGLDGIYRAPH